MKNKKVLLIVAAAFIVLIAAASVLYSELSDDYEANQISTDMPAMTQSGKDTAADTSASTDESDTADTEAREENLAPDFTAYDADGNKVKLSDFRGKPVVLNFWATWCGYCTMEMPTFDEKYKELEGEVVFLMVNVTDGQSETFKKAHDYITDEGYTFPVLYDLDLDAAETYSATALPTTYFIDKDGNLIARGSGALSEANLQKGIDMIK